MKRSGIRRSKSKKQREFDRELDKITPELRARAEEMCELMIPNVCSGSGNLHRHHRRSRRIRKDGLANDLSNLILVCQPCHQLIHHKRNWSKHHGFIISTNSNPKLIDVNLSGARWMA